jgi:hypothetical protein
MAGSPIKHERNRLIRAAILRGIEKGMDPVDYVHDLVVQPVKDVLQDKDAPHAAKIAAANFFADRIDGKPAQEISVEKTETRLVDAGLVGSMGDLLKLVKLAKENALVPVGRVIEQEKQE